MISDTRYRWGWSVSRQSTRRRIVIVYWLFTAIFSYLVLVQAVRHHGNFFDAMLFNILIFLPAMLGGVRAGGMVKPFRRTFWASMSDHEEMLSFFHRNQPIAQSDELDERETRLRDRIHFISYTAMRWFALAVFALYALFGWIRPEWLGVTGPMFLFLVVIMLWSLPQSIILWNEPDVEEAQ